MDTFYPPLSVCINRVCTKFTSERRGVVPLDHRDNSDNGDNGTLNPPIVVRNSAEESFMFSKTRIRQKRSVKA